MTTPPQPKISVVVPCYNGERFVAETLASVVGQSMSEWECIVIDDGSTDASAAIARKFAAEDNRFRVFNQRNAGRALALRTGCQHVNPGSTYLFFLDADDLLHPNALSVLSNYLDHHPDVVIAACQVQLIDAEGRPFEGLGRSRWTRGPVLPRKMRTDEKMTPFVTFFCATGQGPFAMHRKSAFARTEGFDERFSVFSLHEDTDIFCQMALVGGIHYLSERLYFTRRHDSNVSGTSNAKVQTAYGRFREKWDCYRGKDARQDEILNEASRFYYGLFMPCRNLEVALRAFREGVADRKMNSIIFGGMLLKQALFSWIRYSIMRQSPRRDSKHPAVR